METYYIHCAVPKPQNNKKKKAYNGYKDKPERRCYYCGKPYAERHEVYSGSSNRQISIDNGFQVDLCPSHHKEIQANVTEWAQKENLRWKQYYQNQYIEKLIQSGMDKEKARTVWYHLIGKFY